MRASYPKVFAPLQYHVWISFQAAIYNQPSSHSENLNLYITLEKSLYKFFTWWSYACCVSSDSLSRSTCSILQTSVASHFINKGVIKFESVLRVCARFCMCTVRLVRTEEIVNLYRRGGILKVIRQGCCKRKCFVQVILNFQRAPHI
jgi:hypothetical protein